MKLICQCCNQPIELTSEIQWMHKNGCNPAGTAKIEKPSNTISILPDGRMNVKEAAKFLGYTPATLACWRSAGQGPEFMLIRRRIFYRQQDLDKWLNSVSPSRSTTQARLKAAQAKIKTPTD